MRPLLAVLFLGASTLCACTMPGSHYDPTPDAPEAPDARPVDAARPDAAGAPAILVDQASTVVHENGSTTISVSLSRPPANPLGVVIVAIDLPTVTAAPGSLTFDASNYQVAQASTLHGVDDSNATSED